jgi:hypothetical protein
MQRSDDAPPQVEKDLYYVATRNKKGSLKFTILSGAWTRNKKRQKSQKLINQKTSLTELIHSCTEKLQTSL